MNTAKGQMSACVMVSRRPSTVYKRWASWAVRWRECSPWLLNSWLSVAFFSFSLLQLYSLIHSLIPIRTHYRPLVNRIRCAAGDVFTKGVFPKRPPSCRVSLSKIYFLFAYLSVFSYPNNTVKCTEEEKKNDRCKNDKNERGWQSRKRPPLRKPVNDVPPDFSCEYNDTYRKKKIKKRSNTSAHFRQ